MTGTELKEVADIINKVIDATPHLKGNISVDPKDFSYADGTGKVIYWGEESITIGNTTDVKLNAKDKFKKYFENVAHTRKLDFGQFYHLLKFDYALATVKSKEIQLSALSYLWDNDPAEHTEFLRRHGFLQQIVDDKIEENKNKIFIFCFSDSFRAEKAWDLYGQNETGIALGFRFVNYSNDPAHTDLYQLKDVVYDSGYDFDFINDIQFRLIKRFKRRLFFSGLSTLSKFYKRAKYSWEREARICFDYQANENYAEHFKNLGLPFPDEFNLEKFFPKQYDSASDRHFIKVPFDNKLFKLKVSEIICGKNITDAQIALLKASADTDTIVWRRE
ncbi:MAG: DUF2971 domain-containing protein [Bacteroidales bacterium]